MRNILKNYLFSLSVVFGQCVIAQNLVPNPSFEEFSICPDSPSQISYCTFWQNGNKGSTDYYNACSITTMGVPYNVGPYGFQYAMSGAAYLGLWLYNNPANNYREYPQVKLTNALSVGNCYYVKFYCNKQNKSRYASNNIALHFSQDTFPKDLMNYVLELEPHIYKPGNPIITDTLNWTEISGIYTATGGEEYITIGNFKYDADTDTLVGYPGDDYKGAYYYIDDVSVINISDLGGMPANAGPDVSIAPGDSIFIGQDISNLNCTWSVLGGDIIASNVSGIYVKPTVMTTYIVEQTLCGVTTTDTVNVYLTNGLSENYKNSGMSVFPNPADEKVNIRFKENEQETAISLSDLQGKKITVPIIQLKANEWEINTSSVPNGMYLLHSSEGVSKLMIRHE